MREDESEQEVALSDVSSSGGGGQAAAQAGQYGGDRVQPQVFLIFIN